MLAVPAMLALQARGVPTYDHAFRDVGELGTSSRPRMSREIRGERRLDTKDG